jgi:hypothetical protein
MANVKAVIIRRDASGVMTNRIITTPKAVNLIQEGLRASDNMTMRLSAEHAVEQGDEIYYIQDVLDVDNLRGVWNFYGGFRDESGYEHDDVYTAPHTMPNCVNSALVDGSFTGNPAVSSIDWRHKGYYKFKIVTGSNDGVKIEKKFKNNNTNTATKIPVIDMSGDFDMIFEFKTTYSADGQILFDNYDHATSSGTGLKVEINPTSTNITITADDGTTETVMVAGSITTLDTVTFVRIRRKAGVFKLYLDGVEKTLTNSTNAGDLNSNQDIHFFKEYNESTSAYLANTGWTGVPIQFRFYNIALPDDEVKKLRVSKPVNTTMKFGGKIWKIEDKGSNKKLTCSSHAKELLGTQIGTKTFQSTPTAALTGGGARTYNRYYATGSSTSTRPDMEVIIQDILKYVDGGVYSYFADEPSTSFQGDFIAEGSLLDILKVMMVVDSDKHMFVVTPRKILFISHEVSTDQVVNSNNYNIIDSGKDDTNTCNSLFVTGRRKMYIGNKTWLASNSAPESGALTITQNTWSTPQAFTESDGNRPVIERIIKATRAGVDLYSEYRINNHDLTPTSDTYRLLDDNTVQFWNDSTGNTQDWTLTYEYTYTYDPTATFSNPLGTTQFKQDSAANIKTNGLYHRNINIPQLESGFDIAFFAANYIADFKDINIRRRAQTSRLVNSLTVGQKVRFTEYNKQTDAYDTTELVVRSIEYSYPQTLTVIDFGEYAFSGFDVEKQTIDSVRGLDTSTSISRY